MDTTQSTNLLEFAEGSFKEEVHIDLEGKQTKTLNCSLCDFTNHNVGGMKRHILGSHKPKVGLRKHGLDESVDGRKDEKKAKVDNFEHVEHVNQKLRYFLLISTEKNFS
jgi:hypothetical protein